MKLNEILKTFEIYTNNEEKDILKRLDYPQFLNSFSERDQFTIEGLIRKSLVIKIGDINPRVIANELQETS
jgi:hypothetical protein